MNLWGRFLKVASVLGWADNLEAYNSAEQWDKKYTVGYELDIAFEASRYACVAALVVHFAGGGPVLDLGCGDGVLARYIRALSGVPLVGVDYSQRAIERASSQGIPNSEFICADIRTFSPRQPSPLIVFNESLYYLKNSDDVLRRFALYLRPDGVYVISMFRTPLTRRAWARVGEFDGKVLHKNIIADERSGHQWRICVLRPTRG